MKSSTAVARACLAPMMVALLGCSNAPSADSVDAGLDASPDAGNYDEHIIEGGGTTGGPIDGLLVIWCFDDPSGDPIEGMEFMVGNDPETALLGTTDASGRVVFEGASLSGPQDVHHFHEGYPVGSAYGINATYVTMEPSVIGYDADPGTVELHGSATGFDTVPAPQDPATQFPLAFVYFGLPVEDLISGDYEEIEQAEDPEFELPVNMLAPELPGGGKNEFDLEVYDRVGALFAVAGIYDAMAGTFTAYSMAVEPGFDPGQDGGEDIELALAFEIVEENTVELTVDQLPSAYERIGGQVFFDLGADGSFSVGVPPVAPGEPIEIRLPDVSAAPFDEATVWFGGYADQDVEDDDDNYPNAQQIVRDVTLDVAIGSGIEIDDLLDPPMDLSWDGAGLSLTMPDGVSYAGCRAENTDEEVLWSATVYEPPADEIPVPDLPAGWGWEGLPESGLRIYSGAASIDGDLDEMVFDELWYQLLASTENVIDVE